MQRVLAVIMAGGQSPALSVLTEERSEAAVPFAGKYRIIDFALSNCVNSGFFNVAVLTQYKPLSLQQHIGTGKPWDLDRLQGGIRILHPSPTPEGGGWQRGTADAVRYNLDFIMDQPGDHVLVLAGDHIYKMDYRLLLEHHIAQEADITVAVHSVSPYETSRFGIVMMDADGIISRFEEKPRRTVSSLASMGIYAFRKNFLYEALTDASGADFGRDLLPTIVARCKTVGYHYQGYWADVGTIQSYYEANMGLLAETPALDLYDPEWVIHTRSEGRAALLIGVDARVDGNLLCDGCRVYGAVIRSIISPGVVVEPGAVVRDSIIMTDTVIGRDAIVDRCIVDKEVRIGAGAIVGDGEDATPNQEAPEQLNTGLTLVGKRAQIPPGVRIGRNVVIHPRTPESAFGQQKVLPSGQTLGKRR
ncbi:MAG: glucose-1-phosphate adenylyltransferase [Herpetosiphonaceae bacterium]|nr:MAG: glucose-1-phosphate adenylyltransferase [Herpetosiphonaceae bacterium]